MLTPFRALAYAVFFTVQVRLSGAPDIIYIISHNSKKCKYLQIWRYEKGDNARQSAPQKKEYHAKNRRASAFFYPLGRSKLALADYSVCLLQHICAPDYFHIERRLEEKMSLAKIFTAVALVDDHSPLTPLYHIFLLLFFFWLLFGKREALYSME